jgi:hypothetical protein
MHIQIVNFNLNGMTHEEYATSCEEHFGPIFANVPGLISKVWLSDPVTNTYGGVYTFVDKQAMDAFQSSELFQMMGSNPALANLSVKDYGVLEGPTRQTRGLLQAAASA